MLQSIARKRLSQSAVEAIKSYILERKLESGDKLPTERELGEALSISRASVREALRMLEITGLIVVRPGSGIYFNGWTDELALPYTDWLPLNDETMRENYEVRQLVEPHSAYLAAERISPEVLEKLAGLMNEFQRCVGENDLPGMIIADTEFHRRIAEASENKTLFLLMNTITRFLTEAWKASLRIPQRPEKTIYEHRAIFDALKKRNPKEASRKMTIHLRNAVKEIGKFGRP